MTKLTPVGAVGWRPTREAYQRAGISQIQIASGVYAQVGETMVQGVELGVTGRVTPAWMVFGGYTYMDSELVRGAYNGVNQGEQLANTPEHTFSLFTTYDLNESFSFGGGAYYVSDSYGGNQGGAGGGASRQDHGFLQRLMRMLREGDEAARQDGGRAKDRC